MDKVNSNIENPSKGEWVIREALWSKTIFILDIEIDDLHDLVDPVMTSIQDKYQFSGSDCDSVRTALNSILNRGPLSIENGAALFHKQIGSIRNPIQVLVRFKNPLIMSDSKGNRTQFAWILMCETETHPFISSVAEFFKLMNYSRFRESVIEANNPKEIIDLYRQGLNKSLSFEMDSDESLDFSTPFKGMLKDFNTRWPKWFEDFSCGFNVKIIASILFMFFACAAPAVAFGVLIDSLTDGAIGVSETMLASAICGILWALFGGQPLVIVGATGPNVIFTGILYSLCQYLKIDFLGTYFWVGMWTMLMLILLAVYNVSSFIKYFTRFTDEIFACLIAFIFLHQAMIELLHLFENESIRNDSALYSLLLALGTFIIAFSLARFRKTPYLRQIVRNFLSDFGPTIALVVMTACAFLLPEIKLETLNVPSTFQTTSSRSWILNPFTVPWWVVFAAILPSMLLVILVWVNQNITARLVNSPEHNLKKGTAYHWDIFAIGILIGIMSIFGLPWVVGAAVRSINHVKSLLITHHQKITGALENRLSNLGIHVLITVSLFYLPYLQSMPMAVVYGMFLYMGVGTLSGNQFMGRLKLWFMDPELFPPLHFIRVVPMRVINIFTGIQVICLGILWMVKASFISLLFPLFVLMLVPIRIIISKFIEPEYVELLDLDEVPDNFRDFGV